MLNLIRRRRSPAAPTIAQTTATADAPDGAAVVDRAPRVACALSSCLAGERATVLAMGCGEMEACRLRTLGLCEGAAVNVVRTRDCTLLEVRGSRLAVCLSLASDITVLPVA